MRQQLLFPTIDVVSESPSPNSLRLLTLNLQSPSLKRAEMQAEYLLAAGCNVLVLTELRSQATSDSLRAILESTGFETFVNDQVPDSDDYQTVIALKNLAARPLRSPLASLGRRVTVVEVDWSGRSLALVGVYSPSNAMSDASSARRKAFQGEFLRGLRTMIAGRPDGSLVVAGDLNVLEPNHRPFVPGFEPHDYEFHDRLLRFGLSDAFRALSPDCHEHSWIDRFGVGQRLDYAFVTEAELKNVAECRFDHKPREKRLTDHSALLLSLR